MMTTEERALLTDIQDRLIELYVGRDDAKVRQNLGQVCELQIKINDLESQREDLRALDRAEVI